MFVSSSNILCHDTNPLHSRDTRPPACVEYNRYCVDCRYIYYSPHLILVRKGLQTPDLAWEATMKLDRGSANSW